jgi:hypothetical protein
VRKEEKGTMTSEQRAREFLFEWLGVDHRNDCRGSSIDPETGMCDACKRNTPPTSAACALWTWFRFRFWRCDVCWRAGVQLSNVGLRCKKHRV